MEEGLVSAATGALQPALAKLSALLGDEHKGVRGEVELLTRELAAMDAFLLAKSSSEEDPIPSAQHEKACMHEIRELSYDIDDNLDDFMASVCDKSAELAGLLDKMKAMLGRTKARHQMIAKAVDDLKEQVVQVAERHSHKRSKVDRRAPAVSDDASKLVGLDGPKEEIIQLLAGSVESTQHHQQPNLVAIVGSGGTGKTTLANQVCQELKGQFDCHAFCSVSRNPDKVQVMRAIYNQLYCSYNQLYYSSCGVEDLPELITRISDFLEHKRYFIVLDDLWDVEIWKVIECAFPTTSSGSKIITTTRIHAVAQLYCSTFSGHVYNIRPLSMAHSRQLFYTRLFNFEEKCPSYLEGISGQILDKCVGLPLAIIAISGVLADKSSENGIWEQVKDSIGRALRNSSVEDMVNIISLSFLDLPPHLKTCLLYLSIFPEGHIIEKDNLIRRWIGEGFIQKKSGYTIYESGEMCFNDLINRSLIQAAKMDETFGDVVKSCRVHDTVHDFIVSKAVEENFVTIVGVSGVINPDPKAKIRRVSLQNDGEIPLSLDVSSARSLHVFDRNVKIPCLSEFRLLRVLDFEDCSQLEDDHLAGIGNLVHLKYVKEAADKYFKRSWFPDPQCGLRELIIEGDSVKKVPTWVASLVNLEKLCITMDVINERDVEVLRGLPRLRHLHICLYEDEGPESRAAMEKAMEEHPNRPTLVWYED